MQDKRKKIKILWILSIILVTEIIFLIIIYIHKYIQKNNIYQLENKTYYEVTLNPNDYFVNDKWEANNYYIANSIKNIDIYFDYCLKHETKENIHYSYDITATIKSYADNGTKLIWTKDFNLKNINNINERELKINENYQLDYPYYVNYVQSFQEHYHIKTENYLYVKLNVKINDKDYSYVELTIPISENVIEITMEEENTFLENNKKNMDLRMVIVFLILFIAAGYAVFNKNNEQALLKNYQDIIITIQNKPDIHMDNVIYLNSLKDLIHIAVNNNTNMFHYQNNYYVVIDNIYYLYNFEKTI